jgi:hypothetical protein
MAIGDRWHTHQNHVAHTPNGVVGMETHGRIVIARHNDDAHGGNGPVETDKEIVEHPFDRDDRVLDVENVATHHQGVGAILLAPLLELLEEIIVLILPAVVLIQYLPKVKVGSVYYFHVDWIIVSGISMTAKTPSVSE